MASRFIRPDLAGQGLSRRQLLVHALGVGAALSLAAPHARAAAHLTVGQPAPPLVLHTLDGQRIASNNLPGKVVILTFWATWCSPCRDELPLLSDFAARHAKDGLQVLGFSLDEPDNLAEVRKVASALSFPVGLLGSAWAGDYGRVWHLPVNFTIDRKGNLADDGWKATEATWTKARLDEVVLPLLQQ